jgi:hypothetical protein
MTDGGLHTGTITQVFGEKALGKSILSLQTAFATASTGRSAIILDTEQSYGSYLLPYWREPLERRFGKEIPIVHATIAREPKAARKKSLSRSQLVTTLSTTLNQMGVSYLESQLTEVLDILSPEVEIKIEKLEGPSVILLQVPEIIDLLSLHGVDGYILVSEGGRVELRLRRPPVYPSPLHRIVKESNAKLVVYDSISAPLKSIFTGTADLPARSSSLAMMLMNAQRLCIEFDLAVLATSHVTINPIHAWDRRPFGGIILGHEAKFSFELSKHGASRNDKAVAVNPEDETPTARMLWIQRHPASADYAKFGYISFQEDGIY